MRCSNMGTCRAFSAEGYSACRDCDENEEYVERSTEKSNNEEKKLSQPEIMPNESNNFDGLVPPEEKQKVVKTEEDIAYDIINNLVCCAFDSENKKEFIADFKKEVTNYLATKRTNKQEEKIDSREALMIYKSVSEKYPRKQYNAERTFNMIRATLEAVFGESILRPRAIWPEQLKNNAKPSDNLEAEFLDQYYAFVVSLPILERKKLTNGLIHMLLKYVLNKSGQAISKEEYDRVIKECKEYYSQYYFLRKKNSPSKIESKKLLAVMNESLGHEDIGEPFVQIREK